MAGAALSRLQTCRRALPPAHELFEEGNIVREELVFVQSIKGLDAWWGPAATPASGAFETWSTFKCCSCGGSLPSSHLLDLHTAETHDSFFAAQAARKMRVFQCLVEGCGKAFASIMERRQHLRDVHEFPTNYAFDRMHLIKKQGQLRPEQGFQKPSPSRWGARKPSPQGDDAEAADSLTDGHRAGEGTPPADDSLRAGQQPGFTYPQRPRRTPIESEMVGEEALEAVKVVHTKPASARRRGSREGFGSKGRGSAEGMDVDDLSEKLSKLSPRQMFGQPRGRGRGRRVIL